MSDPVAPLSAAAKPTPPTPPCQGGIKRRRPPQIEGLLLFLAPLTRGGRGGCLYPLRRGTFSTTPQRADTSLRPCGKRVVQTRKLSLPGRETTKPCGIHPASLSPRRIPFCPEADLALSFISRERPSIGSDAFARICRYCVSGEMRENPRAESECSHRRGEEENGTSDSDPTRAPRSECSAGAYARSRRRRPRDGALPQRERARGFRIQDGRISPQLRRTRASAARRRRSRSHATPREGIPEKYRKYR